MGKCKKCGGSLMRHKYAFGLNCRVCGAIEELPEPSPTSMTFKFAANNWEKDTRSVWYRTTQVSYTRTMNVEDLLEDGSVRGETGTWWEPWHP